MITKMKKLTFLVYHREYDAFLSEIRNLGVIHIQQKQRGVMSDDLQRLVERRSRYNEVLKEMMFKLKAKADEQIHNDLSADDLLARYAGMNDAIIACSQKLPAIEKDMADMALWGEFDWGRVRQLREAGYWLSFYSCTAREFNPAWAEENDVLVVSSEAGCVNFVTLSREPLKLEVDPLRLPSLSYSELLRKKEEAQEALRLAKLQLSDFCATYYNTLKHHIELVEGDMDMAKVRLEGEPQADGAVMLMEGWIPEENEQEVVSYLDKGSVFYELSGVNKGDNPPIKLKNNWFVRTYEVLTSMYGLPNYTEFDPTPMVAPFFSLFFAFCLGDAGYGLVLILLGMLLKSKLPTMRGAMNLVILLGAFTAVFGTILGTFFGVNLYEATWIPEGVKAFMVSGKIPGTSYDKQMVLALIIGVLHTMVAMLIKACVQTSRYGFKNALGDWGWFLVVSTFPIIGTVMFLQLLPENISTWAFIVVGGVAAIGIYLLNDLHRNVLINIGSGVWATYNMATGLMGDILSYIRLYALGLAGGMLGGVFNQLAFMVQDSAGGFPGWLFCCLILVLGHTLNIAMSCISAFVHPLRLNFVEYFKNSGYEGLGVLYKPFANVERNK